jgi:hypothetical protein
MSSIIRATTSSGLQVAPDNSGILELQTNGTTTAITIDASQNVGIVTTSPSTKLTIGTLSGNATNSGDLLINQTGNTIASNGGIELKADGASNGYATRISTIFNGISAYDMAFLRRNNSATWTESMRIDSAGTLTSQATYDNTAAGSTVVVTSAGLIRRTSSSLKYKKDVETLEQTIVDNAVNNLRPVWYRTKNAEGDDKATWSHIGLIAEEVDLVEPRLVKYKTVEVTQDEKNANVTTELETPVPEDVDYAKLSVILLAKVKQLEARIAVLEAK